MENNLNLQNYFFKTTQICRKIAVVILTSKNFPG